MAKHGDYNRLSYDIPAHAPLFHEELVTGISVGDPGLVSAGSAKAKAQPLRATSSSRLAVLDFPCEHALAGGKLIRGANSYARYITCYQCDSGKGAHVAIFSRVKKDCVNQWRYLMCSMLLLPLGIQFRRSCARGNPHAALEASSSSQSARSPVATDEGYENDKPDEEFWFFADSKRDENAIMKGSRKAKEVQRLCLCQERGEDKTDSGGSGGDGS